MRLVKFDKLSALNPYLSGPVSKSLTRAIQKSDADVIVAGTSAFLYMMYPLKRKKLKNPKPFVYQGAIHFQDSKTNSLSAVTIRSINSSEVYLANTEYEKQRLISAGVNNEIIKIIGCGVDLWAFEQTGANAWRHTFKIKDDNILLGYIGRIERTKSLEVLLNAFLSIQHNEKLHLVIAGYSNKEYVQQLKHEYALKSDRIYFVEDLSSSQKISLYHSLNVFVLPSSSESFGIVFLEAWACKKPVIGADVGAIQCVVTNEKDGLLFKPNNTADLALKIETLAFNKPLCDEYGLNGFKKVEENFTWQVVGKKYRAVFLEAIKKFKKKHP